jgi:hypothetical protein
MAYERSAAMNDRDTTTLNAEEYADQVIERCRVLDAAMTDADRAEFLTNDVVRYICRTTGVDARYVNEESVRTMVERHLAAARR